MDAATITILRAFGVITGLFLCIPTLVLFARVVTHMATISANVASLSAATRENSKTLHSFIEEMQRITSSHETRLSVLEDRPRRRHDDPPD